MLQMPAIILKYHYCVKTHFCDIIHNLYGNYLNLISCLEYCSGLYIGLSLKSIHKLHLALNTAARLISGTHRHSYITPVLQQLNWLPITKRCQFKILILTFKTLHQQTPKYICDLFHWYTPTRALRSASSISLVASRSKTIRYGKRLIDT